MVGSLDIGFREAAGTRGQLAGYLQQGGQAGDRVEGRGSIALPYQFPVSSYDAKHCRSRWESQSTSSWRVTIENSGSDALKPTTVS